MYRWEYWFYDNVVMIWEFAEKKGIHLEVGGLWPVLHIPLHNYAAGAEQYTIRCHFEGFRWGLWYICYQNGVSPHLM